jgi:hypothetical protein
MINDELEGTGQTLARGARHRNVLGTPATTQAFAAQASSDLETETDLGAVAELGYN